MSLEEPGSTDHIPSSGSIQGLDEQLEPAIREDVYRNVIHGFISSGKGKVLKILVIGEAGQGKSTLINALVGKEVAKEGDALDAGTLSVQQYLLNQNGVQIGIWDTPGFGIGTEEEDEKVVEQLKSSDCYPPDLVLFCIRMDQMRIPTRIHNLTIIKLTEVFGDQFWEHALFVLTFANNIDQICPPDREIGEFFSERCGIIEEKLRNTLKKNSKLSAKELGKVRVVPVGSSKKGLYRQNPWALPDREDWFLFFWMDVADRMPPSALSAILQVNHHRLVDDAHSSLSLAEVEPFQRELEATAEEMEKVKRESSATDSVANAEGHGVDMSSVQHTGISIPDQRTKRGSDTGNAEDQRTTTNDEAEPIHNRKIPVYMILMKQLQRENSGFITYLKRFAGKRGEEVKLIGHIGGLIEGFVAYLSKKKQ